MKRLLIIALSALIGASPCSAEENVADMVVLLFEKMCLSPTYDFNSFPLEKPLPGKMGEKLADTKALSLVPDRPLLASAWHVFPDPPPGGDLIVIVYTRYTGNQKVVGGCTITSPAVPSGVDFSGAFTRHFGDRLGEASSDASDGVISLSWPGDFRTFSARIYIDIPMDNHNFSFLASSERIVRE